MIDAINNAINNSDLPKDIYRSEKLPRLVMYVKIAERVVIIVNEFLFGSDPLDENHAANHQLIPELWLYDWLKY
jgi:hypothetical protein